MINNYPDFCNHLYTEVIIFQSKQTKHARKRINTNNAGEQGVKNHKLKEAVGVFRTQSAKSR